MLLMVIVVLSMIVGAQVSDGISKSSGAFIVIAAVCAAFVLLFVGKRCWQLMYLLPAFLYNAPVGVNYNGGLYSIPVGLASAGALLLYGLVLWGIRYISFRWRPQIGMDLCVLIIASLFAWNYIEHPVSIQYFDPDAEYVGGKEFVWAVCAFAYYIALSSMSGSADEIIQVVKKSFYAFCIGQCCYIGASLLRVGIFAPRLGFLSEICCLALFFIYTSAPLSVLIQQPKKLFWGCACFVGILFVGRREILVGVGEALIYTSLLKKEIGVFSVFGILVYGCLFALGECRVLRETPYAVQRVVAVLPGVDVNPLIKQMTEGSSETRRMMWKSGLDPRTGLIRDYIWGDGFQTSTAELHREDIAVMRGNVDTSAEAFALVNAQAGNWHNGFLSTVHRVGLVGLVLVNIFFISGLIALAMVYKTYAHRPECPYLMALTLPLAQTALSYPWGTQNLMHFFACFQSYGLIKMLYCAAREKGMLRPLFEPHSYVPLMIQEAEAGTVSVR